MRCECEVSGIRYQVSGMTVVLTYSGIWNFLPKDCLKTQTRFLILKNYNPGEIHLLL